jgi:hypothetical protein
MNWIAQKLWRVPAWAWLLLTIVAATSIPHFYHRASLPDEEVWAALRQEGRNGLVAQSVFTGICLGASVWRWIGGRQLASGR